MPQRRLFLSRGGVKVVEIIFWVLWVLWTTIPATVQSQVVSDQFTCSSSLTGVMSNDLAGWEAAMVGDVNGDGFGDLLIAAPATNNGSTRSGTVYLIFGTSNLPPLLTSLSTADVTFLGAKLADEVGKKVAGVGDVNGDGYADFVIAAPMANGGAGAANLIFGKSTGWPKQFALDDANAIFAGEKPGDNAGIAVAAAGDVNGDGLNDFIIGAPHSNPQDSDKGKAYLILGKRGGWAKNVALASADVTLVGETDRDLFGLSVAGVGDVDQDGVADIAIGAPYYDLPGTRDAGKVYLFTGKAMAAGAKIPAATASATLIGSQPGDLLGRHISGAGDINGDEIADFTVTALLGNSSGKIYLLFGNALGWGQQTPVDGFAPSFGGEQAGDCAGVPVFLTDWNQDGFSDLLIGAARNSKSATQAGAVYLIPGKATGWNRNNSLSQATVVLRGEKEQDNAGQSLTSGDFDGDGWLELAVGLPGSDAAALNAGMVNLISCPFKPKPASLTLVAPNGGENWQVGSVHPITWVSTGKIEKVRLNYSIDNGVNWKTIVNSTPNDGRFDWTIPDDPSASCLVQIEAANDGEPSDRSDQVFTISPLPLPVTLTLTAPNGGEQWLVGSQHQITWNWSGALAQVKIEYSINNGMTWNLIDPGAANDGSYDWTIPEAPSNFCLVRVSDTIDGQPVDMSDAVFSIVLPAEAITLIAPNGGECWHSGSTQEIKWHATGPISFVKIQYSIDGGNNWITIVSSTANDGSYLWTLPAVHSQNCYVKVADVDCNPEDVSDHPFTIWNRTPITLISPNGGECLAAEQKWEIKWEACCCLDSVKIQYSTDGGIDWTMIVFGTENDGSYLWTVPKTHSDKCLIKVADLDCEPEDISDALFTIWGQPPITVLSPNGGECLAAGQQFEIKWSASCEFDSLKIQYSTDGGQDWMMIAYGTPNDGSFIWNVPYVHSTNCLIKVADLDCHPEDVSDQPFTIWGQPPITVITPNGGESLTSGVPFEIKWEAACYFDSLKIQFSSDNGSSWSNVVRSTPNDGSYLWTVPNINSDKCLIKVADLDCEPFDVSDRPFAIWGPSSITVVSPNGGECLKPGQLYEIKWNASGQFDSVKIQYSANDGNSWETIAAATVNDGSYQWNVPNIHSTHCLVQVADRDGNPADVSDQPFTIWGQADVTVISPNGGECLTAGQQFEIKWDALCCLDSLKIQYSSDGGQNWNMIVYGTSNDGSYLWSVPDIHSTHCLVKVADLDCDPFDVSDQPFTIWNRAPITVLAPNGGECFKVGEQAKIEWTAACYLDSLKIQYSTDNGTTWINIVYGTPNDGSYLWTVPNINSDNCLIKVADLDCDPFDVSDKPFAICSPPYITVLQPNGNECLLAGSPYPIKWQACCFIDSVKIQFSNDNGKNWTNIVATTENDGIFAWTVPPVLSDSCLIKVADVDGDPVDVSDKAFAIKPLPTWQVVQPNGGEILSAGANFEIRWTSCGYQIDTVKIQYSTDGGKNWLSIIYRTANDGSYTWKIPNTPSDSCLVKVADVDCEPTDVSDGFFAIKTAAVANFDATIMTGAQPLEVQFVNLSSENAIDWQWNFGDGSRSNERAPVHIYNRPGNYAVQLIARFPSQIDSITRVDFIRVHSPETYAQLQLADASPTLPQQDGGNATDGDMYGWDGTTVLEGHQPYLIFSVVNGLNRKISGFGLIADTGIGYEERWIHRFQVQISTAGSEANEFQVVLDTVMTTGGFEIFTINPIQANFVKLQVVEPPAGPTHLGEFQVYLTDAEPATVAKELQPMPGKFSLEQNYPNPFNPTTMIRFQLAQATVVRLEIYTVLGTAIRMLVTGPMAAGIHELRWDGKNSDGEAMPSGVYLAVLTAYGRQEVRKLVLAK